MKENRLLTKIVIAVLVLLSLAPISIGYSYWNNLIANESNNLVIGEWWGTPIYTAQEFYDFAMKSDSSSNDVYYLANDIDFSGFSWGVDSSQEYITFRGTLDGNGKTISNLTIYPTSSYTSYIGIFPQMEGGSVYNLVLSNVETDVYSFYSSIVPGLITGRVIGSTNTISDITIVDSGVRGTSSTGTGGLVGAVENYSTVLNIDNVKAINLKVFSTTSYVGGIIGSINDSGVEVNLSDIDISGEVSSMTSSSYTGGIIGKITNGAYFNLQRAIVDMGSQNTLETYYSYYNHYSERYLGGFIGYNQSTSDKVILDHVFFTGSLVTDSSRRSYYIGTAIGRSSGSETMNETYYSQVLYRDSNGSITYYPSFSPRGVMATMVNASTMPSVAWWDAFSTDFYSANSLWLQDSGTGRLELFR